MSRRWRLFRREGLAPRKRIFRPEENAEVPKGWLLHAHKARDSHDLEARICVRWHYCLGAVVVALSAIASGLSAGGTFSWLVAFMSLLASVLAGWQTFFNFGDRAEQHRTAGIRYKAMIRKMEQLSAKREVPDDKELTELCIQLNGMEAEAPVIPLPTYSKVQDQFANARFFKTIDSLLAAPNENQGGT